ncbi:Glutamine synthetase 1, mitochondrial [Geodia barretti]|uniref:Glutamine synthetase 1, mitochondrial n=1 Tax=Geodia barretti TaxID=519541 RepID=A0AA35SMA6_GEOBA|nr:Glutamine synthetase 1, mitochondrial [Geodia barretti]
MPETGTGLEATATSAPPELARMARADMVIVCSLPLTKNTFAYYNYTGRGYLEDRRPSSNSDPYLVCEALVRTAVLDDWTDFDWTN